jgi:dipeptide/tripeptide permease
MVVAFVLFAAGKPFYATEVIVRRQKTPEERAQQWQVVGRIAGLFLLVAFFWAIFDQSTSTWVFFANTYMDRTFFGHEFDPEQFGTLNPFLIVLLIPVVTAVFNFLANRGIKVRATDKMVVGFLLTAATMGAMAVAGFRAGPVEGERPVHRDGQVVMKDGQPQMEAYVPPERKVTIWWQVLAFFLITVAEILISVTGLELAFTAAPASMKSFVTGLWLAAVGLGNLLFNVPVAQLYPLMDPGTYFAMLTGMLLVVTVAFVFVARRFNQATPAAQGA